MSSIFSKIINNEIPAYKIAENNQFIAILDIFPVAYGHTLVIPKVEIDAIFDIPDAYLQNILIFAKPIAVAIKSAYPCNRVNIITVGLEVPHAHIHLIPTMTTTDMNILRPKLNLSVSELQKVQSNILTYYKA
ncbi:MAG: HIT family protein [Phycisphaerales bacterium]|nr:HIT family protein [Phycisphaerales bacterium]